MHTCVLCQALERELAPVEERLSNLREIARKVVLDNPQDSRPVQAQQSAIIALWEKLKVCHEEVLNITVLKCLLCYVT